MHKTKEGQSAAQFKSRIGLSDHLGKAVKTHGEEEGCGAAAASTQRQARLLKP